jgi:hypothetical protein
MANCTGEVVDGIVAVRGDLPCQVAVRSSFDDFDEAGDSMLQRRQFLASRLGATPLFCGLLFVMPAFMCQLGSITGVLFMGLAELLFVSDMLFLNASRLLSAFDQGGFLDVLDGLGGCGDCCVQGLRQQSDLVSAAEIRLL